MNTVDDLRRTLQSHSGLAPHSTGMVAQARLGAVRIRRRRRIATTVAAAAAALAIAVGIPLATHNRTLPANPAPVRSAGEMTIGLDPGSEFIVQQRVADGARQLLVTRGGYGFAAEVWGYDPGAFDDKSLPAGEKVQVGGHEAVLVPALSKDRVDFLKSLGGFPSGPQPSVIPDGRVNTQVEAAVVWRDPSGIWVTVSKADSRDQLLRLAGAVRVGPALPPLGPVGLSWLPDGLAVTHAETMETFPGMYAQITLTVPEPDSNAVPAASAASQGPGVTRVEIYVESRTFNQWNDGMKLPKPDLTVAGRPAWYQQGAVDGYTFGDSEARLLIDTGSCGIRVHTDDFAKVPRSELEKMMNLATYGGCGDMSDWTPVIS